MSTPRDKFKCLDDGPKSALGNQYPPPPRPAPPPPPTLEERERLAAESNPPPGSVGAKWAEIERAVLEVSERLEDELGTVGYKALLVLAERIAALSEAPAAAGWARSTSEVSGD
jgi:hypothetical protein